MEAYNQFFKSKFQELRKQDENASRLEILIQVTELWENHLNNKKICKSMSEDEIDEYFKFFNFFVSKKIREYKQNNGFSGNTSFQQTSNQKKQKKNQGPIIQINYCQSDSKFVLEARYLAIELIKEFKANILKSPIHYESQNISVLLYREEGNVEIWSCLRDGPIDYYQIIQKIRKYLTKPN